MDVKIRWPDGSENSYLALDTNRWVVIRQGKGVERSREFDKPGGE